MKYTDTVLLKAIGKPRLVTLARALLSDLLTAALALQDCKAVG